MPRIGSWSHLLLAVVAIVAPRCVFADGTPPVPTPSLTRLPTPSLDGATTPRKTGWPASPTTAARPVLVLTNNSLGFTYKLLYNYTSDLDNPGSSWYQALKNAIEHTINSAFQGCPGFNPNSCTVQSFRNDSIIAVYVVYFDRTIVAINGSQIVDYINTTVIINLVAVRTITVSGQSIPVDVDNNAQNMWQDLSKNMLPPMPQTTFLGRGYDVFNGNPLSTTDDGGFRSAVCKMSTDNTKTDDKKYAVPTSVEALPGDACSISLKTTDVTATTVDTKKRDISVELGIKIPETVSFVPSVTYQEMYRTTRTSRSVYQVSTVSCLLYRLSFTPWSSGLTVTDQFAQAVRGLPATPLSQTDSYNSCKQFITTFGTHYISAIGIGGRATLKYKFDYCSFQALQSKGYTIALMVEGTFYKITGSAKLSTGIYREAAQTYTSSSSSQESYFTPRNLSTTADLADWNALIDKLPMPTYYVMAPFSDFLTTRFFPDDNALETKKNNLEAAIQQHASSSSTTAASPPICSSSTVARVSIKYFFGLMAYAAVVCTTAHTSGRIM